jgi:hypothetical protein
MPAARPPASQEQGMTNADGTTGCYPPGRGFESRRVRHHGPVAQRLEQGPVARQGDVSSLLSSCPTTFRGFGRACEQGEQDRRRDECLWNSILTFGSRVRFLPELPIGSVAQSVEQKGSFTTHFSSHLTKKQPRRMPDGTTAPKNGMLREVRLLTLAALSGTSGTPGFHLILSSRPTE